MGGTIAWVQGGVEDGTRCDQGKPDILCRGSKKRWLLHRQDGRTRAAGEPDGLMAVQVTRDHVSKAGIQHCSTWSSSHLNKHSRHFLGSCGSYPQQRPSVRPDWLRLPSHAGLPADEQDSLLLLAREEMMKLYSTQWFFCLQHFHLLPPPPGALPRASGVWKAELWDELCWVKQASLQESILTVHGLEPEFRRLKHYKTHYKKTRWNRG